MVETTEGPNHNEANTVFATDLEKSDLPKHSGGDQRHVGISWREHIEYKNCFLIN